MFLILYCFKSKNLFVIFKYVEHKSLQSFYDHNITLFERKFRISNTMLQKTDGYTF